MSYIVGLSVPIVTTTSTSSLSTSLLVEHPECSTSPEDGQSIPNELHNTQVPCNTSLATEESAHDPLGSDDSHSVTQQDSNQQPLHFPPSSMATASSVLPDTSIYPMSAQPKSDSPQDHPQYGKFFYEKEEGPSAEDLDADRGGSTILGAQDSPSTYKEPQQHSEDCCGEQGSSPPHLLEDADEQQHCKQSGGDDGCSHDLQKQCPDSEF